MDCPQKKKTEASPSDLLLFSFEASARFEPAIRILQTLALPLGHDAIFHRYKKRLLIEIYSNPQPFLLERAMGFEPTTFSLARRRTTTVLRPQITANLLDRECRDPGSDWGHRDFQSRALPTELSRPDVFYC